MSSSELNAKSYFVRNYANFDVLGGQDNNKGLRECQLGAYWAVLAHYTTSDEPALVSLPTGSGKTALMMAISFGLKAKRVLIITPAEVLRDQTKSEFESLKVLKNIGVLREDTKLPKVLSNGVQLRTKQQWHDLASYDVVTATPKTTSPAETKCNPPEGIFDLVFLDEAHHAPAPTWTEIMKVFKGAKCVLLTATPFRRDRHRIRAPLVYHYSIGKALDKGIYRPVEFHAVKSGSKPTESDKALCLMAKQVLSKENNLRNKSKLLIRANRVDWANRLVKLYQEHGINVEAVNYEKPWEENKATIEAVRNDQLDGLVCVGMIGEGLDLPALKIAVLHSAPKSLPFTLQFIGRISRTTKTQVGDAHLIAIPDEVRGEMRKLYRSDVDWKKLVPKLADKVIGKTPPPIHMSSRYAFDEWDISSWDLKPFFSARVYAVNPKKVDFGRSVGLPEGIGIGFRDLVDQNLCAIITEFDSQPPWAKDTEIREARLDLHVFYYHDKAKLLFETTTSDTIAKAIRRSFVTEEPLPLPPNQIMRALQAGQADNYYMVGLKNVMGRGPAQPSYKTLMGTEVQAAVRPTDGGTFAPGHALAQLSEEETRGIGTMKSRVWAIKRDHLSEFRNWCGQLVSDLQQPQTMTGLPQLSFLASSKLIDKLRDRPVAVLLDDSICTMRREISPTDNSKYDESQDIMPCINILEFNNGILNCEFCFNTTLPGIPIQYNASAPQPWNKLDDQDVNIFLERPNGDVFEGDLLQYLEEFPPYLVMPQGGVIIGNWLWEPQQPTKYLPPECLRAEVWHDCEITNEARVAKTGKKNIHDWLEEKLKEQTSREAIVIKDHGSGEIADFIVIDTLKPTKVIEFYHCKGMHGAAPGDRVVDGYEVLGQACRTRPWIRNPEFMKEIYARTQKRAATLICKGTTERLQQLSAPNEFSSNAWTYRVIVVQPGFAIDKLKSVAAPLIATYELLRNYEAEFIVLGS